MKLGEKIKLSCIISIFNRSNLLDFGLASIAKQTMSKEDFEVLIIDDNSTEDLSRVYEKYNMNIRHIQFDHTQHPIWKEMQENNQEFIKKFNLSEFWFHTPALSINLGIKQAKGEIICISQPEIIHSPFNFQNGYNLSKSGWQQVFGEHYLSTPRFLEMARDWKNLPFEEQLKMAEQMGVEYQSNYQAEEYYWIAAEFIPTESALKMGGVDEEFLRGVYGEDDDFRRRGRHFVRGELFAGRRAWQGITGLSSCVVGIHLNHNFEKKKNIKQDREGAFWNKGAAINRDRIYNQKTYLTPVANQSKDWGSEKLITMDYAKPYIRKS